MRLPSCFQLLSSKTSVIASEVGQTRVLTSRKTKSRTVFGPRRMKAGVQPLKRNLGPSARKELTKTLINEVLDDWYNGFSRSNK